MTFEAVCAEIGTMDEETPAAVVSAKWCALSKAGQAKRIFRGEKRVYNQAILEIGDDVWRALRLRTISRRALQYDDRQYIDFGSRYVAGESSAN